MKPPEDIKKGHECCASGSCLGCPYKTVDHCVTKKNNDVKAYINTLECMVLQEQAKTHLTFLENENLRSKISQVEQERDAVMAYLKEAGCEHCKHAPSPNDVYIRNECCDCVRHCNFEWRGVCAENTEEDSK